MTEAQTGFQALLGVPTTRLRQVHRHSPTALIGGDCFRTGIACLLGVDDPELVPHFVQESVDAGVDNGWDDIRRARLWLRTHEGLDLAPVMPAEARRLGVAFAATVQSKAGPWGHTVVVLADGSVHCPSGTSCYSVADINEAEAVLVLALPFEPGPDELARLQGLELTAAAAG